MNGIFESGGGKFVPRGEFQEEGSNKGLLRIVMLERAVSRPKSSGNRRIEISQVHKSAQKGRATLN
jgi:hypothetical protein